MNELVLIVSIIRLWIALVSCPDHTPHFATREAGRSGNNPGNNRTNNFGDCYQTSPLRGSRSAGCGLGTRLGLHIKATIVLVW